MIRVECSPWFPIAWSRAHGMKPVPFEVWCAWHHANLLPLVIA